jgi:hypothetical protein
MRRLSFMRAGTKDLLCSGHANMTCQKAFQCADVGEFFGDTFASGM